MVVIPKVSLGGIYQIDVGSYHSIVDVNSGIDYVRAMVGRFSWVPLTLKRIPRETHGGDKKTIHYTLHLHFEGNIDTINQLREDTKRVLTGPRYSLPMPEDINPKMDDGGVIEYTDDEEKSDSEPSSKAEPEPEAPEMGKTEEKPDLKANGQAFNELQETIKGEWESLDALHDWWKGQEKAMQQLSPQQQRILLGVYDKRCNELRK